MPRLSIFLFLLLLIAGCARPPVPLPTVPPGLEDQLLEGLAENARHFTSLQGLARVKLETDRQSLSVNQVLLLQKPGQLRAETLSPFGFGSPLLLMATDGATLSVWMPSEGHFYRGEASYRNLQRFLRLPLQLTDLIDILLYQPPVIDHQRRLLQTTAEGYLLSLYGAKAVRQELRFDRSLHLVESAYFEGEGLSLRIGYNDFSDTEPAFPRAFSLEAPAQQVSSRLTFAEVETNRPVPAERFTLTPPAGVKIQPFPQPVQP